MSFYKLNDIIVIKNNKIGIGTDDPQSPLDLSQRTDGILVPQGTTLQRPSNPSLGLLRFNTDTKLLETYINTWIPLSSDKDILVSVSPSLLSTTGSTATVTGNGFVEGMTFSLISRVGTFINIPVWTLNSSTTVTITRPDISANLQPYSLIVTLPSGVTYTLDDIITVT